MSKKLTPARRTAFELLQNILYHGAFANIALDKALFASSMDEKDRALTTEIVYGTVKYRDRLSYIIDQYSKRPVKKMDPKTASILLMSVYQLDQLDKIPNHAVVHEAVELAKSQGLPSSKLINAVLRTLIRAEGEVSWPNEHKQKALYLAKTESFPQWMIEAWIKKFGYERTKALCAYFNAPAKVWLRSNRLKIDRPSLMNVLGEEGAEVRAGRYASESIEYLSGPALRELKSFKEGFFSVQDQGAMLVAPALGAQAGEQILDMCAAPGGKTTHLAELMGERGSILAFDLHPHRVELIRDNARRLGIQTITCETRDASLADPALAGKFDRVLLDAPCTGLGVLNRRPDARWQKRRSQIPDLLKLQTRLLDRAAEACKLGGRIVYATCSLLDEENKDQVTAFLERHPTFSLLEDMDAAWSGLRAPGGMRELQPDRDGTDGFFIAGLVKEREG